MLGIGVQGGGIDSRVLQVTVLILFDASAIQGIVVSYSRPRQLAYARAMANLATLHEIVDVKDPYRGNPSAIRGGRGRHREGGGLVGALFEEPGLVI